ncbi:MOSC domain-containing protein [Nonomuraea rhodomycinica]|uniref:MOSC domain-containing protein n=1 Tax=Nonomuraea rhodomycinica TaxID=1712872 RepID=A0A7Y6IXI2_9ACTN|nr:MOSC N-terminal beta barrel domain-containing protein [Nonomuraea rhodomycinica]NUW45883.1 MOSC domain-containing protein [Nonomuraea rhodomycinica]
MFLDQIMIYPLKSGKSRSLAEAVIHPWGLEGDRRWAVVDERGDNLWLGEFPRLASVAADPTPDGGLRLAARGMEQLIVPPATGATTPVGFTGLDRAVLADGSAHAWFTELLGRPARLVWLDDPRRRSIDPAHGGLPGEVVSFAWDAPLLLISESSARVLDEWLAEEAAKHGGEVADHHGEAATDHGDAATDHGEAATDHGDAATDHGDAATDQGDAATDQGEVAIDQGEAATDHGEDTPVRGESALVRGGSAPLRAGSPPLRGGPEPLRGGSAPLRGGSAPLRGEEMSVVRGQGGSVSRGSVSQVGVPGRLSRVRFRPSVIIEGAEAFAEDRWSEVRIGTVPFRVSELCDRCAVTTIDPETQVKGKEPLRTLARHRKWDGKTWFGIRLVPLELGRIRVGDPVSAR